MSSANTVASPLQAGRRSHARRRIEGLTYVEFGPDNGAILIDVGEGGLGFQSVMPVSMNQALLFKFKLPGGGAYLEGFGEVAWMNDSGKGGGLRFMDVDEAVSSQIREWAGVLFAPENSAVTNGNEVEALLTEIQAQIAVAADATQAASPAVSAAEAVNDLEILAVASEAAADAETAEIPNTETAESPSISPEEIPSATPEVASAAPVAQQAAAHPSPAHAASPIPEFIIEVIPAPASIQPSATPIESVQVPVQNELLSSSAHSADAASGRPSQKAAETSVKHSVMSPKPPAVPAPNSKLDSRTLESAKRFQQTAPAAKPEIPAAPSHNHEPAARESFGRRPLAPAPATTGWGKLTDAHAANSNPWTKLPQPLQVGIGAAAGAALILALVLGVPYLKTQLQATANARSASSIVGNPSTFEIEVADINNRRWILRSGGDAGSPFGDGPSKRDTQSASRKSSRSDDSDNSVETSVATPQPKIAKPSELALARPRVARNSVPSAQPLAPSIFDGITPPIGSVTDRLATGGPEAPGIVLPESESAVKRSTLQAAVLVQRVSPIYPVPALQAQVQGEVLVNASIGKDGVPRNLKVIKGDQRLIAAAVAAIGQWRYRPATLAGEPIETQIQITIDFHLK
jgi:TonB family protein